MKVYMYIVSISMIGITMKKYLQSNCLLTLMQAISPLIYNDTFYRVRIIYMYYNDFLNICFNILVQCR